MQKLYYNGDIITMEAEDNYVEAVLVKGSTIRKVGSLKKIKLELGYEIKDTEMINLKGKTLLPAFIDTHSHISTFAKFLFMVDLSECACLDDIVKLLKTYIKEKRLKKKDSVIGFRYDHSYLKEKKHPTKDILNQVSTTNPIYVTHVCGHLACANEPALKRIGISKETKNPEGGYIGREEGSLEPNGYLEGTAMSGLRNKFLREKEFDLSKLIEDAQDVYLKNGITTVQDIIYDKEMIELFEKMATEKKLKVDVIGYLRIERDFNNVINMGKQFIKKYNNQFKIGGYKLMLDGSPLIRTAWLSKPYEGEEEYRGYPRYKDEQVKEFIKKSINDNFQLLAHCNGDASIDQLIRLYKESLKEVKNENKENLRPVAIHCQTLRYDQLDKMIELNMIPSIYVAHTYYWGDIHLINLGFERGSRISPAKTALEKGLRINFHTDSPVVKPLILHTIWCAVNRHTRKGVIIGAEECISVYDALKAVTLNAAYQYFEEDSKGSIKEGKLADFIILDKNPLKINKMEIKDIQVLETIKEGQTLYNADWSWDHKIDDIK